MDVTEIPFVNHIGIERKEEGTLKLEPTAVVQNHIQTIHASAQFTLAETQSGLYLQESFFELKEKVVAVLRASTVKYKNPATTTLYAQATIDEELKQKFLAQFKRKGRGSIKVEVSLEDKESLLILQGIFVWFVQKI